jgi:hypothetical protein
MSEPKTYPGRCQCGAIRFRITPPTLFCAHCHCRYCRQAHGAAFVTWVGVNEGQLDLEQGDEQLTWFASSRQSRRGFCSRCGGTLFFKSTLAPGETRSPGPCFLRPPSRLVHHQRRSAEARQQQRLAGQVSAGDPSDRF